jgi:hypothetical protein
MARVTHALEPVPLVIAALVGAVVLWAWQRDPEALLPGAAAGVAVQLTVRLVGVS